MNELELINVCPAHTALHVQVYNRTTDTTFVIEHEEETEDSVDETDQ